jgi:hypothetical protein
MSGLRINVTVSTIAGWGGGAYRTAQPRAAEGGGFAALRAHAAP